GGGTAQHRDACRRGSDGDRERVDGHVPARAARVVGALREPDGEAGNVLERPRERRSEHSQPGEQPSAPHEAETCVATTATASAATAYQYSATDRMPTRR